MDMGQAFLTGTSDADPDQWIRICIIKGGSVWRDSNTDPGHIQ